MKKSNILLVTISIGMLLASCNSGEQEDHSGHNHDNHSEMESHENHDHDHGETPKLGLNAGQKWKVNAEMMVPVREMETTISGFMTAGKEDYTALGKELKDNIGQLTSSCTMTGESHDQLHLWLMPHIEWVEKLNKVDLKEKTIEESKEESKKIFAEIKSSMATFNQFFE